VPDFERAIAEYVVEQKSADYIFTVKDNQPTLRADIEALKLPALPPAGLYGRQGPWAARNARAVVQ
jgi:hypothetical protein